jgi:hypothetical protein
MVFAFLEDGTLVVHDSAADAIHHAEPYRQDPRPLSLGRLGDL